MITINEELTHPTCEVYEFDILIGTCSNDLQVNDILIQVKEMNENYQEGSVYFMFNNIKVPVLKYGRITYPPSGFYDKARKQRQIILNF